MIGKDGHTDTDAFKTDFGTDIFNTKYRNDKDGCGTWTDLAFTLVGRVCSGLMSPGDMTVLARYIAQMKFIPAGRYLYYAGRPAKYFNNCFAFIAEDSREGWAELGDHHFRALMIGGGCVPWSYSRCTSGSTTSIFSWSNLISGYLPLGRI